MHTPCPTKWRRHHAGWRISMNEKNDRAATYLATVQSLLLIQKGCARRNITCYNCKDEPCFFKCVRLYVPRIPCAGGAGNAKTAAAWGTVGARRCSRNLHAFSEGSSPVVLSRRRG